MVSIYRDISITYSDTVDATFQSRVYDHLLVGDTPSDSAYIALIIKAAVRYCENYTSQFYNSATVTETIRQTSGIIHLFHDTAELTSFEDSSDVAVPATSYEFFKSFGRGAIRLIEPLKLNETYTIAYTAPGLPDEDKLIMEQAALLLIATMYENREDTVRNKPSAVSRLLDMIRVKRY